MLRSTTIELNHIQIKINWTVIAIQHCISCTSVLLYHCMTVFPSLNLLVIAHFFMDWNDFHAEVVDSVLDAGSARISWNRGCCTTIPHAFIHYLDVWSRFFHHDVFEIQISQQDLDWNPVCESSHCSFSAYCGLRWTCCKCPSAKVSLTVNYTCFWYV